MSREEFAAEFQAAYRRLWLVAASLVENISEADDVVQDAALVAFRRRATFRPGTGFLAWTSEIVRRCAANSNGKKLRRKTHCVDPTELDDCTADAPFAVSHTGDKFDLSALEADFDDAMLRGLRGLSPEARMCLLLRVIGGLSYAEIADATGLPEGTAMSHVFRSKRQLRRHFGLQHPASSGETP